MRGQEKIQPEHLSRKAFVYVRQSSPGQVLDHPESGRRQRELKKLLVQLGWPTSKIEVLDDDQGKSGQVSTLREAFKYIVGEVSLGQGGIVVGLDVSRLARNNADWFPLIEMCALTGTLVADEEGVYEPNDPNDRLVLGIKGTLSEAEVVRMKGRLHGARWSLARRGELRRRIPAGYAWDEMGRVVLDPNERVRSTIHDLFMRFEQIGSARGVAVSYSQDGLLFPRRDWRSRWDGPVKWKVLSVRHATKVLHNPFYAGVYGYGERRAVTVLDPETKCRKTTLQCRPMEEWEVFLEDAHPVYITLEQFHRNQERLRQNRCVREKGAGAVRSGATLLQGIVYCSRCDRRMGVRYEGRNTRCYYFCCRHNDTGGTLHCMSVPSERIDRWVEEHVLKAIEPIGIEAALEAVDELEKRGEDLKRQWKHRIEQAEYEAGLARRRYDAVDPDNRLVVANLERDWEVRLRNVEQVRKEYGERAAKPPIHISQEDRQRVRELARDLPRLWRAKTTKPSDRVKIVRILVRDAWLAQDEEPRRTRIRLHWQTGAVTDGSVPRALPAAIAFRTPENVIERLRELYALQIPVVEIVEQLNQDGLKTGRGKSFNVPNVKYLLRSWNIRRTDKRSGKESTPIPRKE